MAALDIVSQVIVITLPIIGMALLILILNVVAPLSHDVRVINYVVPVVPRVTGRVIEVPVEPNRPGAAPGAPLKRTGGSLRRYGDQREALLLAAVGDREELGTSTAARPTIT